MLVGVAALLHPRLSIHHTRAAHSCVFHTVYVNQAGVLQVTSTCICASRRALSHSVQCDAPSNALQPHILYEDAEGMADEKRRLWLRHETKGDRLAWAGPTARRARATSRRLAPFAERGSGAGPERRI